MRRVRLHCCLLDLECLRDCWRYGAPPVINVFGFVTPVPGVSKLMEWRSHQIWIDAVPVSVRGPKVPAQDL